MADVVLFHHVLGLTNGIKRLADELRRHGHEVVTPDMYEGKVFSSLEDGMANVKALGFDEVTARGARAAEALSPALVYMGYSLGGIPAQKLAQTRPGARGAILVAACLPPEEFGSPWPQGVPLQIHAEENDPEFDNGYDLPTARAVVDAVDDGELFLYPGDKHFFADSSLPDYEPEVARQFMTNVLAFLDRLP